MVHNRCAAWQGEFSFSKIYSLRSHHRTFKRASKNPPCVYNITFSRLGAVWNQSRVMRLFKCLKKKNVYNIHAHECFKSFYKDNCRHFMAWALWKHLTQRQNLFWSKIISALKVLREEKKKKKISCPWFLNLPLGSLSLDLRGGSLVLQSFLMNLKQQLGGMEDVVLSTLYSRSLSTVRSQG